MDLAELTEALRQQASRNVKLGYKVKFELDDGVIFWDGTDSSPEIGNEDKGEADTTIRISAENLEKLMQGKLDPTMAYMTGKLKVDGKMGVALKLTSMFAD
jgi:putative sterol carrier protein